uniref:Ovule protein n=1 Tax=Schistosoma mansoni TaxID=6183 RepID=A0A5K4F986_SCHMA
MIQRLNFPSPSTRNPWLVVIVMSFVEIYARQYCLTHKVLYYLKDTQSTLKILPTDISFICFLVFFVEKIIDFTSF